METSATVTKTTTTTAPTPAADYIDDDGDDDERIGRMARGPKLVVKFATFTMAAGERQLPHSILRRPGEARIDCFSGSRPRRRERATRRVQCSVRSALTSTLRAGFPEHEASCAFQGCDCCHLKLFPNGPFQPFQAGRRGPPAKSVAILAQALAQGFSIVRLLSRHVHVFARCCTRLCRSSLA